MAADLHAMRQKMIAQLEQCAAIAYAAGQHFPQYGKHAPSSVMKQADADAKLLHLIEEYAQAHVSGVAPSQAPSLSRLDELAKVYAASYASPHHFTLSVEGLRNLIAALGVGSGSTP